jgi:predicted O-methyltransferase YrrM
MEAFQVNIIDVVRFYNFRNRLKRKEIKGLISKREAWFLFECVAGGPGSGFCVEIGSFQGYSTVCMAYAAKLRSREKIVAIDPHYGYPHHERNFEIVQTYPQFIENIKSLDLMPWVDVRVMTSVKAAQKWKGDFIRFLWIDGDHSYEGVKSDYEAWEPFLIENGIIAFHDADPNNPLEGPKRLIKEIEKLDKFKPFKYVQGIAWSVKK